MAAVGAMLKRTKAGTELTGIFSVVLSGNYATGGDVVDFAPLIGYTNRQPDAVSVEGKAGFIYKYDLANKKIMVFIPTAVSGNAPFAQHSAAAYDAGASGDTIRAVVNWYATPGLT